MFISSHLLAITVQVPYVIAEFAHNNYIIHFVLEGTV